MTSIYNQFTAVVFSIDKVSGLLAEADSSVAISFNDTPTHTRVNMGYNVASTTYLINYSLLITDVPMTDGSKLELLLVEEKDNVATESVIKPVYVHDKTAWFNGICKIELSEDVGELKLQLKYKYLEPIADNYSLNPMADNSYVMIICSRTYNVDQYAKMQLPTLSE